MLIRNFVFLNHEIGVGYNYFMCKKYTMVLHYSGIASVSVSLRLLINGFLGKESRRTFGELKG